MNRVKRAMLVKMAPVLLVILSVVLITSIAGAVAAEMETVITRDAAYHNKKHEEEADGYFDQLEYFKIGGSYNGDNYNLSFVFDNWSIENIKLSMPGEKGTCTATVKVPVRAASAGIQASIDWAKKIAADNNYTYGKGYRGFFTCCVCAKCTKKSDKKFTCMPFVAAAFAHGTNDPALVNKGRHCMYLDDKNFKGRFKNVWKKVGTCKNLSIKDLQPGDVVIKYDPSGNDSNGHAWLYGGGDMVIEAVPSDIRAAKTGAAKKLRSYGGNEGAAPSKNYVMRYIGGGKGTSSGTTGETNKVTLALEYTVSGDTVSFQGKLGGTDIAGSFKKNGGSVSGEGEYGFGASLGLGSVMNPFGKGSFFITSLACCNRIHPVTGANTFHAGWDLASTVSDAVIYSVSAGTVVFAGSLGSYGNHVVIIKSGSLYVLYGHMRSMGVRKGQTVAAGAAIGKQGSEGRSTGPHLHLEFRKNAMNGPVTANLKGIQPMLRKYAANYESEKRNFSRITR